MEAFKGTPPPPPSEPGEKPLIVRATEYVGRGPESTELTSTRDFCTEGVGLIAEYFGNKITERYGDEKRAAFEQALPDTDVPMWKFANAGNTTIVEAGKRKFSLSGGKQAPILSFIMRRVTDREPSLASLSTEMELRFSNQASGVKESQRFKRAATGRESPKNPSNRPSTKPIDELACQHDGLSAMYGRFHETGVIEANPAVADYVALIYTSQVAKDNAVDEIHEAVREKVIGRPGVTLIPPEDPNLAALNVRREESYINDRLRYAGRVDASANEIVVQAGWNEEQVQILRDLAFLRHGSLPREEFVLAFTPFAEAVRDGDWATAKQCRDFLLTYIPDTFPNWKFDQRDEDRAKIDFHLLEEDQIVPAYRELFDQYRERFMARLQLQKEQHEALQKRVAEKQVGENFLYDMLLKIGKTTDSTFNPEEPVSAENVLRLPIMGLAGRALDLAAQVQGITRIDEVDGRKLFVLEARYGRGVEGHLRLNKVLDQMAENGNLGAEQLQEYFNAYKGEHPLPDILGEGNLASILRVTLRRGHQAADKYLTELLDSLN